jgi:hypothetical protein
METSNGLGKMETETAEKEVERQTLCFDLGTFEGFNFRSQNAIERELTAEEVVNWNHDRDGEAEFWPSGENPGVSLVFKGQNAVSGGELLALDQLLEDMGVDSDENFLQIYFALSHGGISVERLDTATVQDNPPQIFFGSHFFELRKEVAYELFELYYPEEYRVWEKSLCDGLIFDVDRFLDSPSFCVDEVKLGDRAALLVSPQ